MKVEHLGELMDVDPKVAAFENVIIHSLRKHGPSRTKDLWVRTGAQRFGKDFFHQVIEGLVTRNLVTRQTTNRVNSFIYRMGPDKRRRERAMAREQKAIQFKEPATE